MGQEGGRRATDAAVDQRMAELVAQSSVLRGFANDLVEANVARRERVGLAERLVLIAAQDHVRHQLVEVITAARYRLPGFHIEANLLTAVEEHRLTLQEGDLVLADTLPCRGTFCRYGIATASPFEVSDSLGVDYLLVCDSPYLNEVRAYRGSPIVVRSWAVGMVCAHIGAPQLWTDDARTVIAALAAVASDILDAALRSE